MAVAGAPLARDAAGDGLDAFGVADGGAAVLLDDRRWSGNRCVHGITFVLMSRPAKEAAVFTRLNSRPSVSSCFAGAKTRVAQIVRRPTKRVRFARGERPGSRRRGPALPGARGRLLYCEAIDEA